MVAGNELAVSIHIELTPCYNYQWQHSFDHSMNFGLGLALTLSALFSRNISPVYQFNLLCMLLAIAGQWHYDSCSHSAWLDEHDEECLLLTMFAIVDN